jgi:hypothetical protein
LASANHVIKVDQGKPFSFKKVLGKTVSVVSKVQTALFISLPIAILMAPHALPFLDPILPRR